MVLGDAKVGTLIFRDNTQETLQEMYCYLVFREDAEPTSRKFASMHKVRSKAYRHRRWPLRPDNYAQNFEDMRFDGHLVTNDEADQ